jgi:hypothetical protein
MKEGDKKKEKEINNDWYWNQNDEIDKIDKIARCLLSYSRVIKKLILTVESIKLNNQKCSNK